MLATDFVCVVAEFAGCDVFVEACNETADCVDFKVDAEADFDADGKAAEADIFGCTDVAELATDCVVNICA